jgi:hypothetical protein
VCVLSLVGLLCWCPRWASGPSAGGLGLAMFLFSLLGSFWDPGALACPFGTVALAVARAPLVSESLLSVKWGQFIHDFLVYHV